MRRRPARTLQRYASWCAAWCVPDAPPDRPLAGSYAKIREDVAWLESEGVTEVFYDLNFDPEVGNPEVPEAAARERAETIMNELSPAY